VQIGLDMVVKPRIDRIVVASLGSLAPIVSTRPGDTRRTPHVKPGRPISDRSPTRTEDLHRDAEPVAGTSTLPPGNIETPARPSADTRSTAELLSRADDAPRRNPDPLP
jgi:hypothetical protein